MLNQILQKKAAERELERPNSSRFSKRNLNEKEEKPTSNVINIAQFSPDIIYIGDSFCTIDLAGFNEGDPVVILSCQHYSILSVLMSG
jgi:hypothetical protein